MKIALRFVEGSLNGQVKEAYLHDKKHVLVGRDPHANIVLPESDRSASTNHAKIVLEKGNKIFVNDVGSHYGTFVNHKPAMRAEIKSGDFLRFGVKGPLAEFLVVPEGQSLATPAQKPAAPVERTGQSATGAPVVKRRRPAATRMMAAPTPEMLALLAGDVAANVAAAAGGGPAPVPAMPPPAPMYRPQPVAGNPGEPVLVLGAPGQARPLPAPMAVPRPQPVPPPAPAGEPPSGRAPKGGKTQVGMSAMQNPAMRRRLEQQGKLPEAGPGAEMAGSEDPTEAVAVPPGWPQSAAPPQDPALGPVAVVLPGAGARAPAPPPAAPPEEETKVCPFCAERIKKQAIKCRFCGEYLVASHAKPGDPDAPSALAPEMYSMPRGADAAAVAAPRPPDPALGPVAVVLPAHGAKKVPIPGRPPAPAGAPAPAAPPPLPRPAPAPPAAPSMFEAQTMANMPIAPSIFEATTMANMPAAPASLADDETPHWDLPPLDEEPRKPA